MVTLSGWARGLGLGLIAAIGLAQTWALWGLARRAVSSDRHSAWALVAAWYGVLAVAGAEAYAAPLSGPWGPGWVGLGLGAFGAGAWLRARAVATLAENFSPLVELQSAHRLVTTGPYARVRHPAYLGSLLWAVAVPCLLEAPWALVMVALAYAPALRYRIALEERLLGDHFGAAYATYVRAVPPLVPWPVRRSDGPASPGSGPQTPL